VVAPADAFLGTLLERLRAPQGPTPVPRATMGVVRHELPSSASGQIAPQEAIAEIQEVLAADTIYTVDSGEHFLFATHFLRTNAADAYVVMTGLGSMGQSIGAAIGAQLAHPDRTVAAICGDGCFAMNAFEVATAVAERLPIRVFVFNDQRLGMVEIGHAAVYGRAPAYPTNPMDICKLAAGLGARVLRVDRPGDIRANAELLRDRSGPIVVDVRIDPDVRMPKKDRMSAFATKPGEPKAGEKPAPTKPKIVN
jgi:acetolactate synthase-1/2/3 large subunit